MFFISLYAEEVKKTELKAGESIKNLSKDTGFYMDVLEFLSIDRVFYSEMRLLILENMEAVDGLTLGYLYESINTLEMKKKLGQVYTPETVVDYIIDESLTYEKLVENPALKILDPCCGSGFFLIKAYRKLMTFLGKESESKIVENMIYGVDKDEFSVFLTQVSFLIETKNSYEFNIFCRDILLEDTFEKFDLIVGNPPYIGAKNLTYEYKNQLKKIYSNVYKDKSDISYCFFQKGYELLSPKGEMEIVTSRYFLEAFYAKDLRRYIKQNYSIEKIVDFYGENIFKGIAISPLIIKLGKKPFKRYVDYYKPKEEKFKLIDMKSCRFEKIKVSTADMKDEQWIMRDRETLALFKKIDKAGRCALSDIAFSNQGIITGLDKAFVLDDLSGVPSSEMDILKPWIKNSDIKKYGSIDAGKYIIYIDSDTEIDRYPVLKKRLEIFKKELLKRRETQLKLREWYELQWKRSRENFKRKRILFPYKTDSSKFTISDKELYHSSDIYSIRIKPELGNDISEEFLLGFLNSRIFEFYFKTVAKKLNRSIYEYYPNKMMNLKIKIPSLKDKMHIEKLVKSALNSSRDKSGIIREIDLAFFNIYNLSESEIKLINKTLCHISADIYTK